MNKLRFKMRGQTYASSPLLTAAQYCYFLRRYPPFHILLHPVSLTLLQKWARHVFSLSPNYPQSQNQNKKPSVKVQYNRRISSSVLKERIGAINLLTSKHDGLS